MNNIYTIIHRRSEYTDYVRGCAMGASSSDFGIFTTDNKNTAIQKGIEFEFEGLKNTNNVLNPTEHYSFDSTELFVLVNGIPDRYQDDCEEDFNCKSITDKFVIQNKSEAIEIHNEIAKKARELLALKIEEHKNAELAKKEQIKQNLQIEAENRERAEFERLRKKFTGC